MYDEDEWEPVTSRRWLQVVALVVAVALVVPIAGWLFVSLLG